MRLFFLGFLFFVSFSSFYFLRVFESHYFLIVTIVCFPYLLKLKLVNELMKNKLVLICLLGFVLVLIAVVFSYKFKPIHTLYYIFYLILNFSVFIFLYRILEEKNLNYIFNVFSLFCLVLFLAILLIPLILSGMTMGGVYGIGRLAAGANPNFISYFGVSYLLVYYLIRDLVQPKMIHHLVCVLGLVIAVWGMSRTVIFVALFSIFIYVLIKMIYTIANLKISKSISLMLIFAFLIAATFPVWFEFLPAERLGSSNVSSRALAWEILLKYFYEKPIFGYTGWYQSSTLLPLSEDASGIASSAHNTYISLLSEIGVVGLLGMMILPLCILLSSFKGLVDNISYSKTYSKFALIFAVCVFILMREVLERNLFYNYMDMPSFLLLFLFVILIKEKRMEQ